MEDRLIQFLTALWYLFSPVEISLTMLVEPCLMQCLTMFVNCFSLSEFSDENMMDAYNLAICFGPTLMPVPSERDQVQYQSHVIEVVRTVITYQDEIFSRLDPAPNNSTLYERCIVENHRCACVCVCVCVFNLRSVFIF